MTDCDHVSLYAGHVFTFFNSIGRYDTVKTLLPVSAPELFTAHHIAYDYISNHMLPERSLIPALNDFVDFKSFQKDQDGYWHTQYDNAKAVCILYNFLLSSCVFSKFDFSEDTTEALTNLSSYSLPVHHDLESYKLMILCNLDLDVFTTEKQALCLKRLYASMLQHYISGVLVVHSCSPDDPWSVESISSENISFDQFEHMQEKRLNQHICSSEEMLPPLTVFNIRSFFLNSKMNFAHDQMINRFILTIIMAFSSYQLSDILSMVNDALKETFDYNPKRASDFLEKVTTSIAVMREAPESEFRQIQIEQIDELSSDLMTNVYV